MTLTDNGMSDIAPMPRDEKMREEQREEGGGTCIRLRRGFGASEDTRAIPSCSTY